MTQSSDKQKFSLTIILSYKLRCSTRISSPEESCNNTCEKYDIISRVFDIADQLLTRHTPFAKQGGGNEKSWSKISAADFRRKPRKISVTFKLS